MDLVKHGQEYVGIETAELDVIFGIPVRRNIAVCLVVRLYGKYVVLAEKDAAGDIKVKRRIAAHHILADIRSIYPHGGYLH